MQTLEVNRITLWLSFSNISNPTLSAGFLIGSAMTPPQIDESLNFANLKDFVLCSAAERSQVLHLVLICNAINFIVSNLETLTDLRTHIQGAGIELYLTGVKGRIMDRFADTKFFEQLGCARVFITKEDAYEKLAVPHLQL